MSLRTAYGAVPWTGSTGALTAYTFDGYNGRSNSGPATPDAGSPAFPHHARLLDGAL
jgi:hypothetical protein